MPTGKHILHINYYGSKAKLAPQIVSLMGAHKTYVEPFAGSAVVLLNKASCGLEVLNDLNHILVSYYLAIQNKELRKEVVRRLNDESLYSRAEYLYRRHQYHALIDNKPDELSDEEIIERAVICFVSHNQAFSGMTLSRGWSHNVDGSDSESKHYRMKIEALEPVGERLNRVQIEWMDAVECIEYFDTPDTLFYIDPPYMMETRDEGAVGYEVEAEEGLHHRLLNVLNSIEGKAIVSGYDHPLYNEALKEWFTSTKETYTSAASANQTGGERARRIEVFWSNFKEQGGLFDAMESESE